MQSPTSCASSAFFLSVLFFHKRVIHFFAKNPKHFMNDRLVLSKGNSAPLICKYLIYILDSTWAKAGYIDESKLLTLRKIDTDIEGHPTPVIPFVDYDTESLELVSIIFINFK
jgi:transketolase